MTLRKPKDCLAGLLFVLIAGWAWYLCGELRLGTARNMGPGYFPLALAGLLAVLGAALFLRGLVGAVEPMVPFSRHAARAMLAVLGGSLIFGLLIRPAGLVPAVLATALVACLGLRGYGLRPALIVAAVLEAGSAIAFIVLLGLPIQAFGPLLRF